VLFGWQVRDQGCAHATSKATMTAEMQFMTSNDPTEYHRCEAKPRGTANRKLTGRKGMAFALFISHLSFFVFHFHIFKNASGMNSVGSPRKMFDGTSGV
jgi:hypothetical protein